jgi:hypothetical protein
MNIFILTDDPDASFAQLKALLESASTWASLRAAYRKAGGSRDMILWPKHLTQFDVA